MDSQTSPTALGSGSSSPSKRLKHQPLNTGTNEFRLVKLLPKPKDVSLIQCEIQVSNLASAPPYIALSYLWGPPEPCQDIEVDGCLLSIRKNLYDFLAMMTDNLEATGTDHNLLFIDQVCIDQSNVHERNHQVRQMAQIYEKAFEVAIWLGKESDHSRVWTIMVQQLQEKGSSSYDDWLGCAYGTWGATHAHEEWWKALTSNPYWQRLWIVQEVLLSRKLVVAWGSYITDWQWFAELMFRNGLHSRSRPPEGVFLSNLILGRQMRKPNGRHDLTWSQALEVSRGTRCEDPRDKVYGLLGLILHGDKLEPDYLKPVVEVYFDLLRHSSRTEFGFGPSAWSKNGQNDVARVWRAELGLPEGFDGCPPELDGQRAIEVWPEDMQEQKQELWERVATFGTSPANSTRGEGDAEEHDHEGNGMFNILKAPKKVFARPLGPQLQEIVANYRHQIEEGLV